MRLVLRKYLQRHVLEALLGQSQRLRTRCARLGSCRELLGALTLLTLELLDDGARLVDILAHALLRARPLELFLELCCPPFLVALRARQLALVALGCSHRSEVDVVFAFVALAVAALLAVSAGQRARSAEHDILNCRVDGHQVASLGCARGTAEDVLAQLLLHLGRDGRRDRVLPLLLVRVVGAARGVDGNSVEARAHHLLRRGGGRQAKFAAALAAVVIRGRQRLLARAPQVEAARAALGTRLGARGSCGRVDERARLLGTELLRLRLLGTPLVDAPLGA
mmetsp:Transcript_9302/g.38108  ORF Transcript_9302/g.38108 Transcript_9302/m.38108 type:complete len:281 (+) Transcript_9302:1007-1849(+)